MAQVNDTLVAKTIDSINELLFDYRDRKHDIFPNHDNITDYLLDKIDERMDLDTVENAVFIMKELEYVKFESDSNEVVTKIVPTSKGLILKLNGGMSKELDRQKNKDRLFLLGQIATTIAGIYYLIEITKNILSFCFFR